MYGYANLREDGERKVTRKKRETFYWGKLDISELFLRYNQKAGLLRLL